MSDIRPILPILTLLLSIGLLACKQQNQQATVDTANTEAPATVPEQANNEMSLEDTSTQSRGLDANARLAFNFAGQFPILDSLSQSLSEGRRIIGSFAAAVMKAGESSSSEELEGLLFARRDQAREQLQSLIENQDEEWIYQNNQRLETELNRLGLTMLSAEGMFIGLGNAPLLNELVESKGSDALKWYLRFVYASDESANGEYPFLNMKPYGDMIVAAEKLKELSPNPYYEKVESEYKRALLSMTDIHRVGAPNARTEEKQLLVGGVNTEMYPFATDAKSRRAFAEGAQSQYSELLTKILSNVSEMSEEPETLYIILTEWVDGEEMAKNRVFAHLESGEDIPHYLKIRRTNGSDAYAIVYRFFEDAEKAEAAISKIEQEIPTAELRMISVRNGDLYAMEAAMN